MLSATRRELLILEAGDLYIAGRLLGAAPGRNAIYKQDAAAFSLGSALSLQRLWVAGDGSWLPKMLEPEPQSQSYAELRSEGKEGTAQSCRTRKYSVTMCYRFLQKTLCS